MRERSYYVILGVSEDESPAGIRSAYRALARRHHPDVAGEHEKEAFQVIADAYRVLSDPSARRDYDERRRAGTVAPEPGSSLEHAMRPEEPFAWDFPSLEELRESVRPSFDETYDRFLRNFTGRGVPKAERLEGLDFDLILSADEATSGGIVRVPVPTFVTCPACGGSGVDWLLPCGLCARQGVVESERRVAVTIAQMTPPGTIIEVPLERIGIHNFYLRLHVAVAPGAAWR